MRRPHPSIVIDIGIYPRYLQFVGPVLLPVMDTVKIRYPPERLGRLPRVNIGVITDDPNLVRVPGVRSDMVVIITPKMPVFE
jgi:hypothetical protein